MTVALSPACPLNIFLSMRIFPLLKYPIVPPQNGMSGKRGRDKKTLERANIINFHLQAPFWMTMRSEKLLFRCHTML